MIDSIAPFVIHVLYHETNELLPHFNTESVDMFPHPQRDPAAFRTVAERSCFFHSEDSLLSASFRRHSAA